MEVDHFADAKERLKRYRALIDGHDREGWRQKSQGVESTTFIGPADGWIRVEATLREATLETMRDILDWHLAERQAGWHELLIEGRVVTRYSSAQALCWFAYRCPWPLSDRDTLYVMWVDEERWDHHRELVIGCWTVEDDAMPVDERSGYVRIDFECAFIVSELPPQGEGGDKHLLYRYVQRSSPKVPLVPDSFLLGSQCAILLKEVDGLRREAAKTKKTITL